MRRWWPRTLQARLAVLIAGAFGVVTLLWVTVVRYLGERMDFKVVVSDIGDEERSVVVFGNAPPKALEHQVMTGASVEVARPLDERLWLWAIAALAVIGVLTVVAAWRVSRRTFSRVERMTSLADSLSVSTLDRRLPMTGPEDELRQLSESINRMLDRLQDGFDRQRMFVANASHELRTPLTVMRTALEIPQAQGDVPPDLQPAIADALAANQKASEALASLLQLARLGAEEPRWEKIDIEPIAESVLAERAERIEARRLVVKRTLGAAPCVADRLLVERAIANLCDNALAYTPEGGHIAVETGTGDGWSWFTVWNDGSVFEADEVDRLRDAFVRGDRTRLQHDGVGLGLTIVDSVARMHGGELRLRARPEGGLCAELRVTGLGWLDRPGQPQAD